MGQFWDAGLMFYATDFWSAWDLAIIAIGLIYAVMSKYRSLPSYPSDHHPSAFVASLGKFGLLEQEAAQQNPQRTAVLRWVTLPDGLNPVKAAYWPAGLPL